MVFLADLASFAVRMYGRKKTFRMNMDAAEAIITAPCARFFTGL